MAIGNFWVGNGVESGGVMGTQGCGLPGGLYSSPSTLTHIGSLDPLEDGIIIPLKDKGVCGSERTSAGHKDMGL